MSAPPLFAAPSREEIRDRTADLERHQADAVRWTAAFFREFGPPLLALPPELRPGRYREMLAALVSFGWAHPAQVQALVQEFDENHFRHLVEVACAVESCLSPPSISTLMH